MNQYLKIGNRLLDGTQLLSALVRYQLLESLISQVILDEVIQEFPLSPQELFQTLTGGRQVSIPDDMDDFLSQWCQHNQIAPEYFKSVTLRQLQLQKFKQLYFGHHVESEFLRLKPEFDQVEYSLIQLPNRRLAEEIYLQLRDDGASFTHLWQVYSATLGRSPGGRVGPVPLSTLPEPVATCCRQGAIGTVFEPIAMDDQFWVIRLEQRLMVRLTETVHAQILERLYSQWLQAQIQAIREKPGAIAIEEGAPPRKPEPTVAIQS